MYFEKFIVANTIYIQNKAIELETTENVFDLMKTFGFMSFNLIFTALIGLGGLTTIPYCFKMIKQETTKTKIFYILTFIQILLQTTFPLMRAGLVILSIIPAFFSNGFLPEYYFWTHKHLKNCTLVGF